MALTRQLDPEESAEPRKRCSCKIHHPRNSQLWVIDSYCWGRGSRLAERDRLPSLIIRLIIWQRDPLWNANSALINVSQETKQRRAHDISIWYIFLVSGCAFLSLVRAFLNHSSWFYVFIFHFLCFFFCSCLRAKRRAAPSASLSSTLKVHADVEQLKNVHFISRLLNLSAPFSHYKSS